MEKFHSVNHYKSVDTLDFIIEITEFLPSIDRTTLEAEKLITNCDWQLSQFSRLRYLSNCVFIEISKRSSFCIIFRIFNEFIMYYMYLGYIRRDVIFVEIGADENLLLLTICRQEWWLFQPHNSYASVTKQQHSALTSEPIGH